MTNPAPVLTISAQAANLSLALQLAAMLLAILVGRFCFRKRSNIWLIAFAGAFGAMVAHILFDGQAAFLLLFFTPILYAASVIGRRNLA